MLVTLQAAFEHLVWRGAVEVAVVEVLGVVGVAEGVALKVFEPSRVIRALALFAGAPPAGDRPPACGLELFKVNVAAVADAVCGPFNLRAWVGLLGIVGGAGCGEQTLSGAKQAAACRVGWERFGGQAWVFVSLSALVLFEL